ncbi:MAG: HWE histidine kinase domain-containing protein, partial [Pseudomonadota bacterium]
LAVAEVEPRRRPEPGPGALLAKISQLLDRIRGEDDEVALMARIVRLLRAVTGYDRVLAYRFDGEFNGEVIAEEREPEIEPFLGLRFPHWDIPAQARAIMAKVPLRFIADVDQIPSPLLAAETGAPPLDITLAALRGVSRVHMQYLRNMGTGATMTLSVKLDDRLWGIISFHHRRPRTPSMEARRICETVLPFIESLLALNVKNAEIAVARRIEALADEVHDSFRSDLKLADVLPNLAIPVLDAFDAHGFHASSRGVAVSSGETPSARLVFKILGDTPTAAASPLAIESLASAYPDEYSDDEPVAGALAFRVSDEHAFAIFRKGRERVARWAGEPKKEATSEYGAVRLSPRGSFSVYREVVKGRCDPWTQSELVLFRRLVDTIVGAAERHSLVEAQSRQQEMMIDELNHRVRNILALIRSVARQASADQFSVDAYRATLESRINALAAAHDLSAGGAVESVSARAIVETEMRPFQEGERSRVFVTGADRMIKAHQAPIFALVVHELTTNATKHGALSVEGGRVQVHIEPADGLTLTWTEKGGPPVTEPTRRGFGSNLIENAFAFEFGGGTEVEYRPDGLRATLRVPPHVLVEGAPPAASIESAAPPVAAASKVAGSVLIVEDNFMIALDLAATMRELGVQNPRVVSNPADALEILSEASVDFAVLDVNLGEGEEATSLGVAERLAELNVPFIFVTGYGEGLTLPQSLANVEVLAKPVSEAKLRDAFTSRFAPAE